MRGSVITAAGGGLVVIGLLLDATVALANPVNISYLEGKDPIAADNITAYGNDLFGDRVNLYNGALEFEHIDLSLPGNSSLPVALVRRHQAGQSQHVRGQFGDWDLEAPRIGGTFSGLRGWVTSSGGTNRCSGYSTPPVVSSSTGFLASSAGSTSPTPPSAPPAAGSVTGPGPGKPGTDPTTTSTLVGFLATDYWRGTYLHVPGQGSQEVLVRAPGYTTAPSDGNSYPLVTHRNWQIRCLPSLQNGAGEGFIALSPDGVRYRFDWMATRQQTQVKKSGASIGRIDIFLMATEVTDRFGNWVRYTYDAANPQLLTRIEANDGRVITVSNSGGVAISASDGTRTYSYGYGGASHLSTVTRPDGSRWSFNLAPLVPANLATAGEGATCDIVGDFPTDALTGTITHPSGASSSFTLSFTLLGRTGVDRICYFAPGSTTATIGARWPRLVSSQALTSKVITGPGIPTTSWTYGWTAPASWSNCAPQPSCLDSVRTAIVTDPRGFQTRHLFGNRWRVNEGQLLQVDEGWNGSSGLRTTTYRYRLPAGQAFPEQFGTQLTERNDYLSSRHRPQDRRVISLQGSSFTWEANTAAAGFDSLARPILARRYSSLGHTRTDATTYEDNFSKWVLGQLKTLTETTTNRQVERHDYHATTAMRTASYAYTQLQQSYTYNPDGTLATVSDPAGRATTLSQHRRGKPQLVSYPDGTSESQVINNLGSPSARTNAAGTTTQYQYDLMGRVSRVIHPNEPSLVYHQTTQLFEQVPFAELGLASGHWRQTISTGNARTIRYFDALWRPRVVQTYDAANPSVTSSVIETRYDADSRKTFTSYAQRTLAAVDGAVAGTTWVFDAIGRVASQQQSSELGVPSTTTTAYLTNFQKRVTNPRGFATTYAFQAFDVPQEDNVSAVSAPEGSMLAIQRDVFGNPSSITRSGLYGGQNLSVTRSYVYDPKQRLCKTIEPESGATVQDYDSANNLAWRASGLALPSTSSCDTASAPPSRKISYGYDLLNRLLTTTYGDGSPGISRSYTADGRLASISSGASSWTYGYNNRRLLTSETLNQAGGFYGFAWGIEPHGHASSLAYPGGPTVNYVPDALGRPTQVSGFASGVWHHPNGQIGGYTLANGVAHSTTQNIRGLPLQWRDAGVVQDLYAYDANGNVAGIADQQEGLATRAMGYDGLDRLTSASGIWGAGAFGYDTLDNLRSSVVGSRSVVAGIDAANRLVNVTLNGAPVSFGYDAGGNLTQRGTQGFGFDIGNRLQSATGRASYSYDGHGRRSYVAYADGQWKLQIYSQAGKLLGTRHSSTGDTRHIYLGERLIAEMTTLAGTSSTSFVHTDALGSPVARTNASRQITSRTRYEPYGATAAGTNPTGVGFTGHVNDADTGLVYMQQRYYDPLAGRFLSVDPVTTDAKTGDSFNRYEYADNNPYKYTDPDGRSPKLLLDLGLNVALNVLATGELGLVAAAKETLIGALNPAKTLQTAIKLGDAAKDLAKSTKTFQTYTKTNPQTGAVYCGRTSGCGTPLENMANRDANHHMNKDGYGPAALDKSSTNSAAIRGREQQNIDANGGAQSSGGTSGNAINGISPSNPKRDDYIKAAVKEFGPR